MATQLTFSPDANVAANTAIDLGDELPGPMDTRAGRDPVRAGSIKGGSDDTSVAATIVLEETTLASIGQGAAADPLAGEVVVVDEHTIALGDALDNNSFLELAVEVRGDTETVIS